MARRSAGLGPDEDDDFQDCVSVHSEGQDELDAWLDAASAASQGLAFTADIAISRRASNACPQGHVGICLLLC